jgi:hypothetical protein
MARSGIQFQKGLSLLEFQRLYGTEELCEAALEKARWPDGFRCPRCKSHDHGLVYGRRLKRYQCRSCGHQAVAISHGEHRGGAVPCGALRWTGLWGGGVVKLTNDPDRHVRILGLRSILHFLQNACNCTLYMLRILQL